MPALEPIADHGGHEGGGDRVAGAEQHGVGIRQPGGRARGHAQHDADAGDHGRHAQHVYGFSGEPVREPAGARLADDARAAGHAHHGSGHHRGGVVIGEEGGLVDVQGLGAKVPGEGGSGQHPERQRGHGGRQRHADGRPRRSRGARQFRGALEKGRGRRLPQGPPGPGQDPRGRETAQREKRPPPGEVTEQGHEKHGVGLPGAVRERQRDHGDGQGPVRRRP